MKRRIALGLTGTLGALLLSVSALRGQRTLQAPEPPEPPETMLAPLQAAPMAPMALLGDGSWLGVYSKNISPERARELKLPGDYGVVVTQVEEGSPAAKAGVQKDDVILEFGGELVRSVVQFQRLVRETPPGNTVDIKVNRGGQARTLSAKLEEQRGPIGHTWIAPQAHAFSLRVMSRGATLGISADDLTKQLADYFGVKQGKGVLVREVVVGSAAEKAGLKAGDVIVKVDSREVASASELRSALPHDLEEKRKVSVTVVRDHHEQTLSVELEPAGHPILRETENWFPGLDPSEITRFADAYRQRAAEVQRQMQEYQRQWQQQWQRYRDEYQRALRLEIEQQKQRARELVTKINKTI